MAITHKHRKQAVCIGSLYGLLYLVVIGDISFIGPPAWDAYISNLSLEAMLSARGTMLFETVGVLEMGYFVWLVSPVNLLVCGLLSGLLAANVHGVLFFRSQPQSCSGGRRVLVAGGLPALLAGGACCAPSLILLLGIPALGAFGAFLGWLIPVSVLALSFNRLWQLKKGAPVMWLDAR